MLRPVLFSCLFLLFLLTSCAPTRLITRNIPGVRDYRFFAEAPVAAPEQTSALAVHPEPIDLTEVEVRLPKAVYKNMEEIFQDEGTLAFLMLKDDTILYENYFNDYSRADLVTSFSIAKAVTYTLVAMAVDRGYIPSLEQPVTDWIPELLKQDSAFRSVRLKHFMDMTSGIKLGATDLNRVYYGRKLDRYITRLKLEAPPGTRFEYNNANTQVLAFVLERATGKQLETLLQEWLWRPLGMESDAIWSQDRKGKAGTPKAFCCINAHARDFARFGRLYLNNGVWEGQRLLPTWWIDSTRSMDTTEGRVYDYHGHWHHYLGGYGFYQAGGLFEQYILYSPERDMVIVHFCEQQRIRYSDWKDRFTQMFDQLDQTGALNRFYPELPYAPYSRPHQQVYPQAPSQGMGSRQRQ